MGRDKVSGERRRGTPDVGRLELRLAERVDENENVVTADTQDNEDTIVHEITASWGGGLVFWGGVSKTTFQVS